MALASERASIVRPPTSPVANWPFCILAEYAVGCWLVREGQEGAGAAGARPACDSVHASNPRQMI
jgi:hypothetical protein